MRSRFRWCAVLLLGACASAPTPAPTKMLSSVPAPAPALARVESFVDSVHGVALPDPYRWLENLKSAESTSWVKAQASYTEQLLAQAPGQAELAEAITAEIAALPTLAKPIPAGTALLLERWPATDLEITVLEQGAESERLLVSKAMLEHAGRSGSIRVATPSWDGRFVAITSTGQGDSAPQVSVLDIKTGELLADHVNDLLTTTSGSRYQVTWLPDSSGFIYPRLAPGAEAGSAVRRLARGRQYLHRLGTPSSSDTPVFGFGVVLEIALADDDLPAATITAHDSKWLIASIFRVKANRSEVWAAPIEAVLSGTARWRAIASEGISQPTLSDDQLYGVSALNADRRAIVRLDLRKIDSQWQTFVPERVGVMHRFALASDALYFTELLGSDMQLYRAPYDQSAPQRISVPIKGSLRFAAHAANRAGVMIEAQNFGDPGGWFQVAADSEHAKPAAIASGARAQDRGDLVSRQISVPTQDGLQIPVSLLHHRDLVMDGNTPLLLEAYGGYGQVHLPNYNPFNCTWVRQGAIYAYAHVRGGGELGRSWHQSALRENKILSTTDTLAVARFLIERRYTSKGKIALLGTSSGAQIPGLAITLAPELFGAAIFNVGTPDEIRGAQLDPTAARNIAEMGDMDSSEGVALLKRYSPYHRVPARLGLPTTIVKSAADDYNFGTIAGAAKYVARLQAANSGNRPVLWANQAGGHSDFFDADPSTAAGWMAFVLWQTGHPDFQPKPTK